MKTLIHTVVISFTIQCAQAQVHPDFWQNLDDFAKQHVQHGTVDYGQLKTNPTKINQLVKQIETARSFGQSAEERKAFLINAYNVLVIKQVVDNYPISSALKVDGFFDNQKFTVAGRSLTLDEIEKKELAAFKDPRIHFALVCAAQSCPELARFAFRPATVDRQLTERTFNALMDAKWLIIKPDEQKVELSKIFNWYIEDFNDPISFINAYRTNDIPSTYQVSFYTFNWQLNDR